MGWSKVEVTEPHRCDTPYYKESGLDRGDVIRCDCGQYWKLEGFDTGMQWDPFPVAVNKWRKCVV